MPRLLVASKRGKERLPRAMSAARFAAGAAMTRSFDRSAKNASGAEFRNNALGAGAPAPAGFISKAKNASRSGAILAGKFDTKVAAGSGMPAACRASAPAAASGMPKSATVSALSAVPVLSVGYITEVASLLWPKPRAWPIS